MKKILIIDDNKDVLVVFKQLLLDKGFGVSAANKGTEGLDLFKRDNFDLVITDSNMAGISDFDVAC